MHSLSFLDLLKKNKINFYTGIPDSLMKDFLSFVEEKINKSNHHIAANEGSAIGIGIGYHLSTGQIPLIYLQNSGLGNCINPLVSLADPKVYSIPMVLLIGWRGEKNTQDEPQHVKQGAITESMLKILDIPFVVLSINTKPHAITRIINLAKKNNRPVALLVKKNFFKGNLIINNTDNNFPCTREDVIKSLIKLTKKKDIIASTTGMASRELSEIRENLRVSNHTDFLTIGGMGHASQIALGIAITNKNKRIICIDGDGSAIMHMGGMASIGSKKLKNYKHLLINNGVHGSVGGQETDGFRVNFKKIAIGCGYEYVNSCSSKRDIEKNIRNFLNSKTCSFLEIKVNTKFRSNLKRPKETPIENKNGLMKRLI